LANASASNTALDVVKGFLNGAVQEEKFTDLEKAVTDAQPVYDDVVKALKDIQSGSAADMIEAVALLGKAMEASKKVVADWDAAKTTDIARLEEMAALFKNPKDLEVKVMTDIKLYGQDIEAEVTTAIADLQAQRFYDLGYQIGEAAFTVLMGEPAQKWVKSTRMLQGITKSFGGSFNFEALLVCIYDEDNAALAFDMAFQLLEEAIHDKDLPEAIGAVIATIAGYQQFVQGLPACRAIDTTSWNYAGLKTITEDNHKINFTMEQLQDTTMWGDLVEAVMAYKNGEFEKAGEFFGKLMQKVHPVKEDTLFLY
jgi:hypothetical protein